MINIISSLRWFIQQGPVSKVSATSACCNCLFLCIFVDGLMPSYRIIIIFIGAFVHVGCVLAKPKKQMQCTMLH